MQRLYGNAQLLPCGVHHAEDSGLVGGVGVLGRYAYIVEALAVCRCLGENEACMQQESSVAAKSQ